MYTSLLATTHRLLLLLLQVVASYYSMHIITELRRILCNISLQYTSNTLQCNDAACLLKLLSSKHSISSLCNSDCSLRYRCCCCCWCWCCLCWYFRLVVSCFSCCWMPIVHFASLSLHITTMYSITMLVDISKSNKYLLAT
jgi:hypothetical protein